MLHNTIIHKLILSDWIPLITAFITGGLALLQIRRNNITQARLEWLQKLKSLISEFLIQGFNIVWHLKTIDAINKGFEMAKEEVKENKGLELNKNIHGPQLAKNMEEIGDNLKKSGLNLNLILLNLNPFEIEHSNLEKHLREFHSLVINYNNEKDSDLKKKINESIKSVEEKIVLLSRYIFKLEWEKTKGKTVFKWFKLNKIKKAASKIA